MPQNRRIDTKKVEKAAVLAVKNRIQRCPTIDEKIQTDDKNMLIDGTLELFRSEALAKEHLIGCVEVQVKGTASKLEPNKRGFVKFRVDVADLRGFRDIYHGVLFFCVRVREDHGSVIGTDVYYASLLPYDINQILAGLRKPKQKTVFIRVFPFPKDPDEITRLIMDFHTNHEKQLSANVMSYGLTGDLSELPSDVTSLNMSMHLLPGETITSLKGAPDGTYLYAEDKHGGLSVVSKVSDVRIYEVNEQVTVTSGDFSLLTDVRTGKTMDGQTLAFEGVRITLSPGKARLDYSIYGSIRKRYNTLGFVQEFMRTGIMDIDDARAVTAKIDDSDPVEEARISNALDVYGSFVETLDALHIKADWDPAQMTDGELADLEMLHQLVVEGEPYRGPAPTAPLVKIDIQGGHIYVFAIETEKGDYEVLDLHSEKLLFAFGELGNTPENLSDPVPPFAALRKERYQKIVNLDAATFSLELDRHPVTASNHDPLNERLLEMLGAIDAGCQCPDELLDCAIILARKLYEFDLGSPIDLINLMQATMRQRELTNAERSQLEDIVIDSEEMRIRASAYALLGNQDLAHRCLERCSEDERLQLQDNPIFRFLKGAMQR